MPQAEASDAHGVDLNSLRASSQATIEQIRAAHRTTIDSMTEEHSSLLEAQVKALEKQLSNQALELKATKDDLSKAKAAAEAANAETASLKGQLDSAAQATANTPDVPPAVAAELQRLKTEVSHRDDDLSAHKEMLALTKESLTQVSNSHQTELNELAESRAKEVSQLREQHDELVKSVMTQKTGLQSQVHDLEGEVATLKAKLADSDQPAKVNGTAAHPASPGFSKEELQKLHEAHNLKVHDIQSNHQKEGKELKARIEELEAELDDQKAKIEHKNMEIKFLESSDQDSADEISRYVICSWFDYKHLFLAGSVILAVAASFI